MVKNFSKNNEIIFVTIKYIYMWFKEHFTANFVCALLKFLKEGEKIINLMMQFIMFSI